MGNLKKNIKWIVLIVLGIVISCGISVYATSQYLASQVTYNNTNVASALDDLYNKVPNGEETITANGHYDISKKASVNVNVTVAGTKTLLWTNPNSLTTDLNSTESITLNDKLSNYSHILIQWIPSTSNTNVIYEDIFKISPYRKISDTTGVNVGDYGVAMTHSSGNHVHRSLFYTDDTQFRIGGCVTKGVADGQHNESCIFYKIYGLNFSY